MEPQERDLITTLLDRLKSAGTQPKDPEADQLIHQAMTQMPDAPYYLVQTVLIQDISLQHAQNRIADLERQVAALPPPQSTSFLGGLLGRGQQQASVPPSGPWTRAPQAPPPQYAQQPQYAQPQPQYAQQQQGGGMFGGGGNSFLKSAAATAAGVAGGALLFQGISSLFGHGYASGLGGFGGMGGMGGGMGYGGGISETVINNYGDQGGGGYAGGDYGGGGGGYAGGDYSGGGGGGDYGGGGGGGGGDYGGGGGDGGYDSSGGGDYGGGGGDSGGSSSC